MAMIDDKIIFILIMSEKQFLDIASKVRTI